MHTAAYGYVLSNFAEEISRGNAVVGSGPAMSNNVAEYAGLSAGLQAFLDHINTPALPTNVGQAGLDLNRTHLQVRGDSKLVIYQMNKRWKAKGGLYFVQYEKAAQLCKVLRSKGIKLTFDWVPRTSNTECDELSKLYVK